MDVGGVRGRTGRGGRVRLVALDAEPERDLVSLQRPVSARVARRQHHPLELAQLVRIVRDVLLQ